MPIFHFNIFFSFYKFRYCCRSSSKDLGQRKRSWHRSFSDLPYSWASWRFKEIEACENESEKFESEISWPFKWWVRFGYYTRNSGFGFLEPRWSNGLHSGPDLKKSRQKTREIKQIKNFFTWNCIFGSFNLVHCQKWNLVKKIIREIDLCDFTGFFWPGLF